MNTDLLKTISKNLDMHSYLWVILIFLSAILLNRIVQWLLPKIADRLSSKKRLYILPLIPVIRLFIYVCSILLTFNILIEFTLKNLIALFGAIGLVIGFALKDYWSSLIAGIVAIYERIYRPGDWVEIDGTYGEVQSMNLRVLRILTPDDNLVTISHQKIWNKNISNSNSGRQEILCEVNFYINKEYETSIIKRKLYDVALCNPFTQLKNPISIIVSEKPWFTIYKIKAYPIDARYQFQYKSELTEMGKNVLKKMNIKSPQLPFK